VDRLWAPWRLDYVSTAPRADAVGACFLCRALAEDKDRENLIAWRTPRSVVVLNRYPYNNGHLIVAPLAHKAELQDLDDEGLLDLQHVLRRMQAILTAVLKPDGFNIGLNLGRVAGAGLPGHLHWHIVPRWNGDTSFMPVVADTKVISQSLDALFDQLSKALADESSRAQTDRLAR
jgi:ATP adenylyltransferase